MQLCAVVCATLGAALPSALAADPKPWPPVNTAVQIQYNPKGNDVFKKPWWYDFPNRRLRTDSFLVKGTPAPSPFGNLSITNFTSIWLNDELSMIDREHNTCVKLQLHMGIMGPDWFLTNGATRQPNVWLTHRSEEATAPGSSPFQNCSWMRKDGAGLGWFDYFASEAEGTAFRLTAPGGQGDFVINDFVEMSEATIADDIFELPKGVTCKGVPGGFDSRKIPEEIKRIERLAAAAAEQGENNNEQQHLAATLSLLRVFSADLFAAAALASSSSSSTALVV